MTLEMLRRSVYFAPAATIPEQTRMNGFHELSRAYSEAVMSLPKGYAPFDGALKSSRDAALKFSEIAFMAARRNAEITGEWTNETLQNLDSAAKAKQTGGEYTNAATEFASASSLAFARLLGSYGDLAMSVQTETLQCFLDTSGTQDQESPQIEPNSEVVPVDTAEDADVLNQ